MLAVKDLPAETVLQLAAGAVCIAEEIDAAPKQNGRFRGDLAGESWKRRNFSGRPVGFDLYSSLRNRFVRLISGMPRGRMCMQ